MSAKPWSSRPSRRRSEEHTSELQSPCNLVCRLLLEKKKNTILLSISISSPFFPHKSAFYPPPHTYAIAAPDSTHCYTPSITSHIPQPPYYAVYKDTPTRIAPNINLLSEVAGNK